MSETAIIWTMTIVIGLGIFLAYYYRFWHRRREDLQRKEEAVRLGADKALTQHPHIDIYKCIGCGSCVRACPEGKVLGVIHGKATLINGLKCVGHGLCEKACPVNAISIGLGDVSGRPDIPILDNFGETNISGLYIAGELGGLALIRNAINQGTAVVRRIVEKGLVGTSNPEINDILVIGAGPAGLGAAMAANEHKLRFTMIDQQDLGGTILQYPRKKLVMTQAVAIPLWGSLNRGEYTKEELLAIWEDIRDRFQLQLRSGEKLRDLWKQDGLFTVSTDQGNYRGRTVVLALGRRGTPRKLNVPGEKQSKVMYQLLDAETYQNEDLLVVGGGDSAIEAAIALAGQSGNRVTISYRKESFFRIKSRNENGITQLIDSGIVQAIFNSNVMEIGPKTVRISGEKGELEIPNDYTFIFAGGEPPFAMLKKFGIKFGGE